MELRYSAMARTRDITLAFGFGVVVGSFVFGIWKDRLFHDPGFASLLTVWVGVCAPAVFVAGVWRWGRRGRLDETGATLALSSGGPWLRLGWGDVEEIYRVGARGFELRGGDVRLRFSDDFTGLDWAWHELGRRRGASLERELRAVLDAGGTLRFGGLVDPATGWLRVAALLSILLPPALAPLGFLLRVQPSLGPIFCALAAFVALVCSGWVGGILWGALAATLRSFGWVEIGPAGLAARGAGPPRRWAWSEIESVRGWMIHLRGGRRVLLPSGLANLIFLESLSRPRIPSSP